jgi:hypothetical protein
LVWEPPPPSAEFLALDRGARAGRRPGAARRALRAVAVLGVHDLEQELAGDVAQALGQLAEGGNHDPRGAARGARGRQRRRP